MRKKESVIPEFPERLEGVMTEVVIKLPYFAGGDAKSYLRAIAKKYFWEMYSQKIETGAFGYSGQGEKISINMVGGWLFGVPRYKGHLVITKFENNEATVLFPEESSQIIHQLIAKIKERIEKKSLSGQKP